MRSYSSREMRNISVFYPMANKKVLGLRFDNGLMSVGMLRAVLVVELALFVRFVLFINTVYRLCTESAKKSTPSMRELVKKLSFL